MSEEVVSLTCLGVVGGWLPAGCQIQCDINTRFAMEWLPLFALNPVTEKEVQVGVGFSLGLHVAGCAQAPWATACFGAEWDQQGFSRGHCVRLFKEMFGRSGPPLRETCIACWPARSLRVTLGLHRQGIQTVHSWARSDARSKDCNMAKLKSLVSMIFEA